MRGNSKESALIARFMGASDDIVLGDPWIITAKNDDFFIEPLDPHPSAFHISCHGPGKTYSTERFHVKIDRKKASKRREAVGLLGNAIPRKGFVFSGQQVADHAFLAVRLRWTWQLERERFRDTARWKGTAEPQDHHQTRLALRGPTLANSAWDLDLFVSFGEPYLAPVGGPRVGEFRVGPFFNKAGFALTGISHHRSQLQYPAPLSVDLPAPRGIEVPIRTLQAGPDDPMDPKVYWCLQTVTSREHLMTRQARYDDLNTSRRTDLRRA